MKRILLLLPALAVFLVAVQIVKATQGLPHYDYWETFPSMLSPDGLRVTWDALYERSNEHIVAATKLVFLLNYLLMSGDNFGLSIAACLFSLVTACLLCLVIAGSERSRLGSFVLAISVATFTFTPLAIHNFLLGMSGTSWLGANMLMAAAATAIYIGQTRRYALAVPVAALLGFIGGQFYSTGLMILCAVGVQAVMRKDTRRAGVALIVLGLAYILVVYALQVVPAKHGARSFNPLHLASFVVTMVGAGLTAVPAVAKLWGCMGIGLLALLAWRHWQQRDRVPPLAAFSMAIVCYALMNAAVGAIGRAGMGGDAIALQSRYAALPALFWIGLLGLALALERRPAQPVTPAAGWPRVGLLPLVALAVTMTLVAGAQERVSAMLQRQAGKDMASLSIYLGIRDDAVLDQYITPEYERLYAATPILRKIGHVPFNGGFRDCPEIGSRIDAVVAETGTLRGFVDGAEQLPDAPWYRVRGWAMDERRSMPPLLDRGVRDPYVCVALVDEAGIVRGLGVGGMLRADVAQAFKRDRSDYGWQAYVPQSAASDGGTRLYAAIRMQPGATRWTRLPEGLAVGR
jgi:hypothetical protein